MTSNELKIKVENNKKKMKLKTCQSFESNSQQPDAGHNLVSFFVNIGN